MSPRDRRLDRQIRLIHDDVPSEQKLASSPHTRALHAARRDPRWRDNLSDTALAKLVAEYEEKHCATQRSLFDQIAPAEEAQDRETDRAARIRGAVADFLDKNRGAR